MEAPKQNIFEGRKFYFINRNENAAAKGLFKILVNLVTEYGGEVRDVVNKNDEKDRNVFAINLGSFDSTSKREEPVYKFVQRGFHDAVFRPSLITSSVVEQEWQQPSLTGHVFYRNYEYLMAEPQRSKEIAFGRGDQSAIYKDLKKKQIPYQVKEVKMYNSATLARCKVSKKDAEIFPDERFAYVLGNEASVQTMPISSTPENLKDQVENMQRTCRSVQEENRELQLNLDVLAEGLKNSKERADFKIEIIQNCLNAKALWKDDLRKAYFPRMFLSKWMLMCEVEKKFLEVMNTGQTLTDDNMLKIICEHVRQNESVTNYGAAKTPASHFKRNINTLWKEIQKQQLENYFDQQFIQWISNNVKHLAKRNN